MDRDPGDQRRASLRASDTDREQFVEALREHQATGRLTLQELSERTEQAYEARTLGDLDALATDVPDHGWAGAPLRGPPAADPASRSPHPPADRQALARAALLRSLVWYGLLSVVLLVVWAMSGRDYFWPIWPILGFALFLGWQVFNVLGPQVPDQSRRRDRGR